MMSTIAIDELLAAIPGDNPCGEDISFEAVYDEIKEARRADADYLSQGDWKTSIKIAEWRKVKQLSCEVLATRSKDLQITCWLLEALTNLHGWVGVADGLVLLDRLLNEYWDSLHPQKEGEDVELRIGRIMWLDKNLPLSLMQLPLTAPIAESKGYSWLHWKESRDVDNLARQSEQALQDALHEGKISSELWESAYKQTPPAFYQSLLTDVAAAQQALNALDVTINEQFAEDSPSISQLKEMISQISKLVAKLALDKGVGQQETATESSTIADGDEGTSSTPAVQGGPIQTRNEALRRLNEVAEYFRHTEPHNPVAYLVEKAARWGNMRLDEWLREVVQESDTRERLRDLLGYSEE